MEKKEMLKDAIKNFGGYTPKQNEVLGVLISTRPLVVLFII